MKKSILIALLFSLVFLMSGIAELGMGDSPTSNTSNTVEVTLLGPKQYIRTNGKPNIYTNTFPGRVGQGKLIVKNGEGSGANRISSAIVKINDTQVLGTQDFNQNVYEIGVATSLMEHNTITVELRSKPGSFLTIQIKEEIDAEAGGIIDPEGGIVRVANPRSPLCGVGINIPVGALDATQLVTISLSDSSFDVYNALREDVVPVGAAVEFGPSDLNFFIPAIFTLIYYDIDNDGLIDGIRVPEEKIHVMRIDDQGNCEGLDVLGQNIIDNSISFAAEHFSKYILTTPGYSEESRWEMESSSGWIEGSQYGDPGGPEYITNQIKYNHQCYSEPPCLDRGDGKSAKIWIDAGTEERVKIRRINKYPTYNDIYVWRVFVPDMEPNARVSIGAFLRYSDIYEFDFEIGWGFKENNIDDRKNVGASRDNEVLCYASMPGHPSPYGPIKIITNAYHTLELRISFVSGVYEAAWYVDSIPANWTRMSSPAPYDHYVYCSVEYLNYIGTQPLALEGKAYFDYVKHQQPIKGEEIFFSNFDDGTLQGWGTKDYSCLSSERAYSGNYSIKVNDIMAGGNEAEVYRIFQPAVSKGRAEFMMYIPSGNSAGIGLYLSDKTYWEKYISPRFQIYFETNGQVYWNQEGIWHQYSDQPIVFNAWNKVILSWDCTKNEMSLKINGFDYGVAYNRYPGGGISQLAFQGMCWICTGIYAWFDDIRVVKY